VRSLVTPELADTVREATYRFCESPTCDVVYFSETDPERRFLRSDLRVHVGQKATEPPIQVCYCFDWTTDDIEREFHLTGTTTIPDRIKEKVQHGFCQCETMNPQGTCCLGNVNKAVNEIRTKLAVPSEATGNPYQGNGKSEAFGTVGAVPLKPEQTKKEKGAWLATLGAVFTAIVGSACCWLPLLLIAFGFSAAGIGSLFEQYHQYFLTATFALLGTAWYFTYRNAFRKAWARLRDRPAKAATVDGCCVRQSSAANSPGCCVGVPPTAGRFTRQRLNRAMLCILTVVILAVAMFPKWGAVILGGRNVPAPGTSTNSTSFIVEGITCEGCSALVENVITSVPGVLSAQVDYPTKRADVLTDAGRAIPTEAIVQALQKAGYRAAAIEAEPVHALPDARPGRPTLAR
jgi:copper chaperone CopZ